MNRPTLLLLLLLACFALGCNSKAQVIFQLKGVAPSADGSFTNQQGWTIIPSEIRFVIGDIHLKRETPTQSPQIYSTLTPLLEPGKTIAAEEIGNFGKFPGMWALNVIHSAQPHSFPVGYVEVANWNQVQVRMSPAVSGVRGITLNDPLLQNTVLLAGQIRKDTAVCNIRLRASIEVGVGLSAQFTTKATLTHRNLIEIKYAKWLDDIQFGQLCSPTTQNTIQIDNNSHPQIIDKIKGSVPHSIEFRFSEGTAQ